MSTLNFIVDLSPASAWTYSTLYANKDLIAKNGYELVPADSSKATRIPCVTDPFWQINEKTGDEEFAARFSDLVQKLDNGQDIIWPGGALTRAYVDSLLPRLTRLLQPKHNIRAHITFANPYLMHEFWLFATPDASREKYRQDNKKLALETASNLSAWQEILGKENVTYTADLSEKISPLGNADKALEHLGLKLELSPGPLYMSLNMVSTATGSRIVEALQVRHNDWPRVDYSQLMLALNKAESFWRPDLFGRLEDRKAIIREGRFNQMEMEKLAGLTEGSLNPPPWFGKQGEADPDEKLDQDKLARFAALLSPQIRKILLERFHNDEKFLTSDQKALRLALEAEQGYCHIGEAFAKPLLTVLTMTCNQENFIADCIESVLAQKTDFPVQHLILDHYSSDGTPAIIEKYARDYPSIRPLVLENYNRYFSNSIELFSRCSSEYAALCDGDDYFTDPMKLQKQVNYLQANPGCAISFHPVKVHFEDDDTQDFIYPPDSILPRNRRNRFYISDLFTGNLIQTNSAVYRWRFRDGLPDWFDGKLCPGDWYWHLLHAETGWIGYLPDIMSVYRRHKSAAYNQAFRDVKEHRRATGMRELDAYDVINRHFNGKFQKQIYTLATGVFNGFTKILLDENDSSLLDAACEKYPKFGAYYLSQLKSINTDIKNAK